MNYFFAPAKLISVAATILLLLAVTPVISRGQWDQNTSPLPPTNNAVNDYVGVFDESAKAALEQKLRDFRQRSGVTLVVAVIKTTGDRPIFDYSLAVYRGWKVGSANEDNPGALLLVAIDDRKYFTQVGRDLEDELPDALAGSIQRQYLVPEFRKGNYAKGITDTLDAYIRTIDQKQNGIVPATPTPQAPESGMSGSQALYSTFCCLVIIGFILVLIFANRGGGGGKSKRDRDRWGGGFGGGGSSALPWIIGSAIGSSGGSSSSSDWGSSSWGGGSSDWGGFGGGDAGGGGAGGDW